MIEFRWFQPKNPNMPPKLQYRTFLEFTDSQFIKYWTSWRDIPTVLED